MSKCLVTGGAGFIGSHVVDMLIGIGHEVYVADNESSLVSNSFYWNKKAKENFKENLCDYSKAVAIFREARPEYIFHLAANASIQAAVENPKLTLENNFSSTMNVLDCSRLYGGKRVIFSSTSSVYGSSPAPQVESSKTEPLNFYAESKVMGEGAMKLYHKLYGLETVCLRYFNVYGERQSTQGAYASVVGAFLEASRKGETLKIHGDGLQERDFIHVGDVARCNILGAFSHNKKALGSIINIGTGESTSVLNLAKMISNNIDFLPERNGETKKSRADISNLKELLNFTPENRLKTWVNNYNDP